MSEKIIDGLKLIKHNMGHINNPDDPSFGPWRLDIDLRPPEFMQVAAMLIYGNEEVVVRGKTQEALEKLIETNHFTTHPRLVRLTVRNTETNSVVLEKRR